jgi:hypothetical protein
VPPSYWLGQSLIFIHVREFAHAAKDLAPSALALMSLKIIYVL